MHSEDDHDPFMIVFLAIIFLFLVYYTLYSLYDLWRIHRSRRHHIRSSRSLNYRPAMFFVPVDPSHIAPCGLDPALLKSLPLFIFSNVTHKDLIDCAVCLSEFEEGEPGRLLPGCKHAFHVECIDMWFHSHSTCPLCRSLVQPLAESVTMVGEEQTVIAISPEPVSDTEPGSTAEDPAATEAPRRSFRELEDDLTQNLRANHSFALPPMSRMLSFTRMLSRKGRSAPSSFAGAPSSQSPSSSCRIVINESDIERGGEEIKSDSRYVDVA